MVLRAVDPAIGRTVALKVIRAGMASRQMLRRFELEAETLAQLRHPGIAQIFAAGRFAARGLSGRRPATGRRSRNACQRWRNAGRRSANANATNAATVVGRMSIRHIPPSRLRRTRSR